MPGGFQQRNDSVGPAQDKFGKPSFSLPTPDFDDLVIVETETILKGTRKWKRPAGSAATGFPTATLIKQTRNVGDATGFVATYIYVTPRVNQDAYNATISYQAKNTAHRVISRSSLVARAGYQALPEYTPDTQTPSALLVDEQAQPAEEPYNTLYFRVNYTFEDFGTRAEQDTWNRQSETFPYLSDSFPRIARRYRFPANAVPTLTIGSTTDTQVSTAFLRSKTVIDESSRVTVLDCTFEAVPTLAQQATLGSPTGNAGLGVSVAFPYGAKNFPVVTWRSRIANGDYVAATDNEACPLPGYSSLVLSAQSKDQDPEDPGISVETREYQILPGIVIYSADAARLPRTLTAIPGTYLNGDALQTSKQAVFYQIGGAVTAPDAIVGGVLSSRIEPVSTLMAFKINIARPNAAYPVLYEPKLAAEYGGAEARQYRQIVEVADPSLLDAAIDAALASIMTAKGFGLISYNVNQLSPTQAEIVYSAVGQFPTLYDAEFNTKIPAEFIADVVFLTATDYVDTTTNTAQSYLQTGSNVISCKVEAQITTRAKRETVTLPVSYTFPTLTEQATSEKATGGMVTRTRQILAPQSGPPSSAGLIDFDETVISPSLVLRATITHAGDFAVLLEQDVDDSLGLALPSTRQKVTNAVAATFQGNPNVVIRGLDDKYSEIITKPAAIQAALDAFLLSYSEIERIPTLPAVLVAANITYNAAKGIGNGVENGEAETAGNPYKIENNATKNAESSSSILPEVDFDIRTVDEDTCPVTVWEFFLPKNNATHDAALAKVGANAWPRFCPEPAYIVIKGQKASVRGSASVRFSYSASAGDSGTSRSAALSSGYSDGYDVQTINGTRETRPVIHGAITLGGDTPTKMDTVSAASSVTVDSITASTPAGTATQMIYASVTPSLPATAGQTSVPVSGIYMFYLKMRYYRNDRMMCIAKTFDFSKLPKFAA